MSKEEFGLVNKLIWGIVFVIIYLSPTYHTLVSTHNIKPVNQTLYIYLNIGNYYIKISSLYYFNILLKQISPTCTVHYTQKHYEKKEHFDSRQLLRDYICTHTNKGICEKT